MKNKILIVDDEELIRNLLKNYFNSIGYSTITAASGEEAIDVLKSFPVQVLFLDLRMPEMDGIELCRKIRETNQLAFIFAVTGAKALFEISECREAGFDDYFTKPINLEQLSNAAKNAFASLERWRL